MPLITGPLKWYTVAETVRAAVDTALAANPPARSGTVPGAIAWDACDCGLLAFSLARVYLSNNFPNQLTSADSPCKAGWEVGEFVVQLIRCTPGADDQSLAPTVAALDASAQEILTDAYLLLRSVSVELCEMKADREIIDFFLNPLTAQGPTGQCGGNELRFLVALPRN